MCHFLWRRKDNSEGRAKTQEEEWRAKKKNSLQSSFTVDWGFGSLQNPYVEALIPSEAVFDFGR